jgi:hypothetical protein
MRPPFTEDFFKNVIGFATVLMVCIGVIILAGANRQPDPVRAVQVTATASTQ